MDKRYHLIIQNIINNMPHFTPSINITLVDTLHFLPVFEVTTLKEYQSNIEEMVTIKYNDDLKIYRPREERGAALGGSALHGA